MAKKSDEQKIYEFVSKNPGKSTYEISKKLRMSGGKIRYYLEKLKKQGLVNFKFERFGNPRIKKLTYPVPFTKLLPKKLKNMLKGIKV